MGIKMVGSLKKQALKLSQTGDVSNVINEIMKYSGIRGLSDFTLKNYRNTLRQFFRDYMGSINDAAALRQHIQMLLTGSGNEYYNKRLSIYRQFFEFCIENEVLDSNPAIGLKFRRHNIRFVEQSDETIQKFLRIINKDTFSGLRDYAFSILILDTGTRPSEALQLLISDIDFTQRKIYIRPEVAKTREERLLPVSLPVIHTLGKLIRIRPEE